MLSSGKYKAGLRLSHRWDTGTDIRGEARDMYTKNAIDKFVTHAYAIRPKP
jgi:hypothetical protein